MSSPRKRASLPSAPNAKKEYPGKFLNSFEIPDRISSLLPPAQEDKVRKSSQILQGLKRKASEISIMSTEESREYVENHLAMLKEAETVCKTTLEGLKVAGAENKITKEELQKEIDDQWTKRATIAQEDTTIGRHRQKLIDGLKMYPGLDADAAYSDLLMSMFEDGHRDKHEHNTWKRELQELYDPDYVETNPAYTQTKEANRKFCVVTGAYRDDCVAAHIVPARFGKHAPYIFGLDIRGEIASKASVVYDIRNGMFMASRVEKGFDRGAFTLVPVERGQDLPVEFKIVLLREDWRKFIAATGTGETWGDLDGRFLKFPNNERPQKRFVYFHYATSILRLQRTAEISAWAKKRMDIPAGKIWATPGAYLRKSMLLVLGQVIGDVDPAQTEEALPETFEEPENQKPVEEEVKMAKEYLALENKRPDDDDEVMD